MRDWDQRQRLCHAHPAHRAPMLKDAFWQMHCELELARPQRFEIESRIAYDRFYRFLERTWMWQQLPPAIVLFALGGWGWVFWGICLRVAVSLTGHWLVGHLAHRRGPMDWKIEGLPVQGHNVPRVRLVTFGECWHNNNHAFPDSALLGTEPGQADPGFWLIRTLEWLGLARDVKTPATARRRDGLRRVASPAAPSPPARA